MGEDHIRFRFFSRRSLRELIDLSKYNYSYALSKISQPTEEKFWKDDLLRARILLLEWWGKGGDRNL